MRDTSIIVVRFLGYDMYDVNLSRVDVNLHALLMHTAPRLLILVEDLDRSLQLQGDSTEVRVLRFMDGMASRAAVRAGMMCRCPPRAVLTTRSTGAGRRDPEHRRE